MTPRTPNDQEKRAKQLVAKMETLTSGSVGSPAFNTRIAMQALHKFACALTVVSAAADRQSRRIVSLTWALLAFTAALFVFPVFLYKDTHALVKHEEQPNQT